MALVAAAALVARPVGAERGQRAEVVEHPRASAAQDLDSLLRHRRSTETRVVDRRHRAVSVLNRDRRAFGRGDAGRGRDSGCEHALRGAAQPVREVEHVARLAEDPAAALERVVEPVLRRDGRVDAVHELESGRPARGPPGRACGRAGANGRLKPIASRSFSRAGLPRPRRSAPASGRAASRRRRPCRRAAPRRRSPRACRAGCRRRRGRRPAPRRPRASRCPAAAPFSERASDVGRRPAAADDRRHAGAVLALEVRQVRAAHEAAGADERDAHLAVRAAPAAADVRATSSGALRPLPA